MTAINTPLIELIDACVEFDGKQTTRPISFTVYGGEFVCLHGNTGSGKSLALRLISGLETATSGRVLIAGDLVNDYTPKQKLLLRRSMGIMVQGGLLLEDRSILDNVMLPAIAAGLSGSEARDRAKRALNKCGLRDSYDQRPKNLSAGQKQLACLARAVVNHPTVILADEPAANLDVENAQQLMDLLGEFAATGVAVVVASHLEIQPQSIFCRPILLGEPS